MIKKVHHIGIAVKDLDKTVKLYSKMLGEKPESFFRVGRSNIRATNIRIGETALEFLEVAPGSSLVNFIETRGEGIHHIAFEVDDINNELKRNAELGIELVDNAPRTGPEGEIAFIGPYGSHGVYIELVQPRKE